jgi:hypothetical protein
MPEPLHSLTTAFPLVHVAPQFVIAATCVHAPAPSHVPVLPHGGTAAHSLAGDGAVPICTLLHMPSG